MTVVSLFDPSFSVKECELAIYLYSTTKEIHQSFLGGIMENRSKK